MDIIYSGPIAQGETNTLAYTVRPLLEKEVFSAFIEQVTNMLMHSTDARGTLMLGRRGNTYVIQTRNAVTLDCEELLGGRLTFLGSLEKSQLREYNREKLRMDNDNPFSPGAGLGLIEISRRATAPIEYSFETLPDGEIYFTMTVEIEV